MVEIVDGLEEVEGVEAEGVMESLSMMFCVWYCWLGGEGISLDLC